MFCDFYGLTQQPFGAIWDPKFAYFTPRIREVMTSMNAAVEADVGLQLLLAKPGVGKTTLLQLLLQRYRPTAKTALVSYTQCTPLELQRLIVQELGFDAEGDTVELLAKLKAALTESQAEQRRVIVFIDEAQNLDVPVLETVRLLSNLETEDHRSLQIVISGQSELSEMLGQPRFTALVQRISVVHRLAPLSTCETRGYIEHRLAAANYGGEPLFSEAACEAVAVESLGIPRNINRICLNAVSLGASMQRRMIDADVIRRVAVTLDVRAKDWLYPAGRHTGGSARRPVDRPAQQQESPLMNERPPMRAAGISRIHPELRLHPAAPSAYGSANLTARPGASARKRWGHIIDVVLCASILLLSVVVLWRWLPGRDNLGTRTNYTSSPQTAAKPADPPNAELHETGAAQSLPAGSQSAAQKHPPRLPPAQSRDRKSPPPASSGETALHPIGHHLDADPAGPENVKVSSPGGGVPERVDPPANIALASTTTSKMPLQPLAQPTPITSAPTPAMPISNAEKSDAPVPEAESPRSNERVVRTGVFPGGEVVVGNAGHAGSEEYARAGHASSAAAPPTSRSAEPSVLVHGTEPQYPDMARQMHVEGDVVLAAEVGGDGRVKHVKVVSGPRILASAAVNAVQQWRYKPVNGQPASSMKQIVVQFRLNNSR